MKFAESTAHYKRCCRIPLGSEGIVSKFSVGQTCKWSKLRDAIGEVFTIAVGSGEVIPRGQNKDNGETGDAPPLSPGQASFGHALKLIPINASTNQPMEYVIRLYCHKGASLLDGYEHVFLQKLGFRHTLVGLAGAVPAPKGHERRTLVQCCCEKGVLAKQTLRRRESYSIRGHHQGGRFYHRKRESCCA